MVISGKPCQHPGADCSAQVSSPNGMKCVSQASECLALSEDVSGRVAAVLSDSNVVEPVVAEPIINEVSSSGVETLFALMKEVGGVNLDPEEVTETPIAPEPTVRKGMPCPLMEDLAGIKKVLKRGDTVSTE